MPAPLTLTPGAFCRTEDVKSALENADYSAAINDTLILYINYFSKMAEGGAFCDRDFVKQERTEYFDGVTLARDPFVIRRILVRAPPIDPDAYLALFDDPGKLYTDGSGGTPNTLLELWNHYHVDYRAGVISLTAYVSFWADYHNIKLIYTGGLIQDINSDAALVPDDLRAACAVQCAHWFRISNDPGAVQISSLGGGQVTMFSPTQILPAVKTVLQQYRRFQF